MFTSRAAYRLSRRADYADGRLTPLGLTLGLVGEERQKRFSAWTQEMAEARDILQNRQLSPNEAASHGIKINQDGVRRSAYDLLAYPDIDYARLLPIWPEALGRFAQKVRSAIEIEASYAVYMNRQQSDIAETRREEERQIPTDFDFGRLPGLSIELRQKLTRARPANLAQAARVDGMTPAALTLLLVHLKRLPVVDKDQVAHA